MQRISITNPQNIIDGTAKKYYFKLRNTGGPKGDKGDKGDTGSRGPQGEPGNAATVYVGSTTTLPVGQDATVENVGTQYNAVLNFGIPQGPRGPQGVKGDPGEPGQKGEPGPRGIQGERGTNATVYVGTTTTTNPGTQARVYNSGTDSNAVLNFEIPRGDVGPQPELEQATGTSTTKAMSQKATTDALNTKQDTISSSNKLSADLVTDTSTTNKFVTAEDKTAWNAKQNALTAGQGIDITSDVISTPALVPEVVASLPAEGTEGKLYLTPKAHTTQTATGNPITASVTEQAGAIESFQLDGDTTQQTYTGKNLFDIGWNKTASGGTNSVDFTTTNGSLEITQTGANGNGSVFINLPSSLLGKTLTLSVSSILLDGSSGGRIRLTNQNGGDVSSVSWTFYPADNNLSKTFSLPSELPTGVTYFRLYFYVNASNIQGSAGAKVSYNQIQIEEGSTATAHEPYVGGQASPNPDYPQAVNTVTGTQTVEVVGKNLLNPNMLYPVGYSETINGVTYTMMEDGGIKMKGTTGSTASTFTFLGVSWGNTTNQIPLDSSKSYMSSITRPNSTYRWFLRGLVNGSVTSLNSNLDSLAISNCSGITYAMVQVSENKTVDAVVYPQIELGSIATTYAPYSKQTYPINLGKNLFDEASVIRGYEMDGTTGAIVENANWWVSDFIPVMPNTPYTSSGWDNKNANKYWYRSDKSYIERTTAKTVTSPSDAAYMRVNGRLTQLGKTIMVEQGSTATDYAPYFTPIELCKLGTYKDYIWKDGEDWKVHKATALETLNGSEDWVQDSSGGYQRFNIIRQNVVAPSGRTAIGLSSHFTSNTTDGIGIFFLASTSSGTIKRFYFYPESSITTVESFESWLNSNKTTLVYPLATPTDTIITDGTLIAQLEAIRTASLQKGTNTITNIATGSNLAGDMEIGYYGCNPTNRYDKFIWLDLNNAYEQLNNPDTSSTLSTLSTRTLGTTTEQPTVTRSLETETITLKKGEAEPIEDKTELPTILDEEAEETETSEPEESDGTDER